MRQRAGQVGAHHKGVRGQTPPEGAVLEGVEQKLMPPNPMDCSHLLVASWLVNLLEKWETQYANILCDAQL